MNATRSPHAYNLFQLWEALENLFELVSHPILRILLHPTELRTIYILERRKHGHLLLKFVRKSQEAFSGFKLQVFLFTIPFLTTTKRMQL